MKKLLLSILFLLLCNYGYSATLAQYVPESISGYVDNNTGLPNSNGSVTFFGNDSLSTTISVYSDAGKTSIVNQPISLNDVGQPVDALGNTITLFVDDTAWVQLKNSSGTVIQSMAGLHYLNDSSESTVVDLSSYGTDDAALTEALGDYDTKQVTFLLDGDDFTNTSARTLPSNIKFLLDNGATWTNSGLITGNFDIEFKNKSYINNSSSITTNGLVIAGNEYIFRGSGNYYYSKTSNPLSYSYWRNESQAKISINTATVNNIVLSGNLTLNLDNPIPTISYGTAYNFGNGNLGDFTTTSSAYWDGEMCFRNLTLNHTITVNPVSNGGKGYLILRVQNNLVISANLIAEGCGALGGASVTSANGIIGNSGLLGGAYGGYGGHSAGKASNGTNTAYSTPYTKQFVSPYFYRNLNFIGYGSGGGSGGANNGTDFNSPSGGNGGGSILITAYNIYINGTPTFNCNGTQGVSTGLIDKEFGGSGGGGGGFFGLYYAYLKYGLIPTPTVNGGLHTSASGGGGEPYASDGQDGEVGIYEILKVN